MTRDSAVAHLSLELIVVSGLVCGLDTETSKVVPGSELM
jgi:hypothetical protein